MFKSIFALSLLFICSGLNGQGIKFVEVTWQEALEMAKAENKLLFVDSYATWCGPCKRMAKEEFVKPEVGEIYNANFINLKLDMESKNGRTFDSQYPVSAYPTMFFLDGDGKVVKKVKGGKQGAQLISMAQEAIKGHDYSGDFREKYNAGDHSYEVVYGYVEALNKSGKQSLRISNKYLQSDPDITEEQKLKFYYVAIEDCDSRIFDLFTENKAAIIDLVGVKDYNIKVKSACKKTLTKALEYETVSLLEEAMTKAKLHLTEGGEQFALECKFEYASSMKDIEMFADVTKSLSKIYFDEDRKKVKSLIQEIHSRFDKNANLIELSTDLAKKYHKKEKTSDSAMVYAKSLMLSEDYKEASKVISKSIKNAEKNGEDPKTLEMMLQMIEMKKA